MFLTKPYRCSIIKCIIVCYTTSINASQYADIDPDFHHQDVLICEKDENKELNNCNNNSKKENEHNSSLPHFKTIVTSTTSGRLGNHLISYMHLMRLEFNFNVRILTEKVVKKSLDVFFKNFNNIQTVDDDACGYYEFIEQLDKAKDDLIINLFRGKSGINVTMERGTDGIRISPIEVAMKYGPEIDAEMDSYKTQFLQNIKAASIVIPSDCNYKVIHKGNHYQMKHLVEKLGTLWLYDY